MATQRTLSTTLLTEHLRYTPLTLLDDIINTVNELIARAVDAAEEGLLAADPNALGFTKKYEGANGVASGEEKSTEEKEGRVKEDIRSEIEEGCHRLETLLESNVDRNFDKLEIYVLRSVLSVPGELVPWVRLGHYEGLKLSSKMNGMERDGEKSLEGIRRLRRKVQETRRLQTALRRQVERNEVLLGQLRGLIASSPEGVKAEEMSAQETMGAYAFLTHTPSVQALGMSPISTFTLPANNAQSKSRRLTTNTSFTLSQLPALKALLAELRPKLASVLDMSVAAPESAAARERRLYLENQTRRALERSGVAIGEGGGSAEGPGRRVGSEELAALEGIVEGMER